MVSKRDSVTRVRRHKYLLGVILFIFQEDAGHKGMAGILNKRSPDIAVKTETQFHPNELP